MEDRMPLCSLDSVRTSAGNWTEVVMRPAPFVTCDGGSVEGDERLAWLSNNCSGGWQLSLDDTSFAGEHVRLHFERDEDSILYRTRWEGVPLHSYVVYLADHSENQRAVERQRAAIAHLIGRAPVREFTEEPSTDDSATALKQAISEAEETGAILIVGSLADLSRDAPSFARLHRASCKIVFADLPQAHGTALRLYSLFKYLRSRAASEGIQIGLQKAKQEGKRLGGDRGNLPAVGEMGRLASAQKRQSEARERAQLVEPLILEAEREGCRSLQQIANHLNARGIKTSRGAKRSFRAARSPWPPSLRAVATPAARGSSAM